MGILATVIRGIATGMRNIGWVEKGVKLTDTYL